MYKVQPVVVELSLCITIICETLGKLQTNIHNRMFLYLLSPIHDFSICANESNLHSRSWREKLLCSLQFWEKLLNIFHGVESFHVFFSGATKEKIVVRNYWLHPVAVVVIFYALLSIEMYKSRLSEAGDSTVQVF